MLKETGVVVSQLPPSGCPEGEADGEDEEQPIAPAAKRAVSEERMARVRCIAASFRVGP
jgi:hypothetical protein